MAFDWDANNIAHVWERHRVRPHEAEEAIDDPGAAPGEAYDDGGVWCESVVGLTDAGRLLFVAWEERGDLWRVISARPASRREERIYWRRP